MFDFIKGDILTFVTIAQILFLLITTVIMSSSKQGNCFSSFLIGMLCQLCLLFSQETLLFLLPAIVFFVLHFVFMREHFSSIKHKNSFYTQW